VKTIQKTFDLPGPINPTAKSTRQVAAEIMAYFKALNYEVQAAEEVITFTGNTVHVSLYDLFTYNT
jgi:hypothetical protein